MKGYYASTRLDSSLIRKAMGSGPGHSGWKRLPSTMSPNTQGTWKCENECAYTHRGTGSPLGSSTLEIRMARGLAVWLKQYSA
jgi:hypothetical protein